MEEHRSKTPGTRGAVRENARWWGYWHSSPLLNTEHRGWLRGSGACAAQRGPHLEGHVLVLMLCCHCQILDHFWKRSPRFLFSTGLYKLCTLSSDVFEKTVVGWLSKYRRGQAALSWLEYRGHEDEQETEQEGWVTLDRCGPRIITDSFPWDKGKHGVTWSGLYFGKFIIIIVHTVICIGDKHNKAWKRHLRLT